MRARYGARAAVLFAALIVQQAMAAEFTLELLPGWNLVSLPIAPDDPSPDAVFGQTNLRDVWRYDPETSCYVIADRLEPGQGYWIYALAPSGRMDDPVPPVTVVGSSVRSSTVSLSAGWNLIGPVSYEPYAALPVPLRVETDPGGPGVRVLAWSGFSYGAVEALACGAGAWVCSATDCSVRISPNPSFAGAVMAYSPEVGEARMHWPEAADDRTAAAAMAYRIYAAPVGRAGLIAAANLVQTVTGGTQAELTGLTPGVTYGIAVVAEDEAGNRNYFNRTELAVPVLAETMVVPVAPKELPAEGVAVQAVSADGVTVTVDTAGALAVGDTIVFDNPNGTGLRRIVAMNTGRAGGIELVTEEATLAQVIRKGILHSSLVVSSVDAVEPNESLPGADRSYRDPAGRFVLSSVPGEDRLPDGGGGLVDLPGKRGTVSFARGVDLRFDVGFEPVVEVEAQFDDPGALLPVATYVRMVASGALSLAATLELSGTDAHAGSVWEKELGGFSHTFAYVVGGVPVVEEVSVAFRAELELSAAAQTYADMETTSSKALAFGFEWDEAGGYRLVADSGFDHSLSVDLGTGADASARLKVYPEIVTRFYQGQQASLWVVPSFGLDARVQLNPPPAEMSEFDLSFLAQSYVEASLGIFGVGTGWTSQPWTMLDKDLFSLPEIGFASAPLVVGTDQPTAFTLAVTDGVNNPVPPANIEWWVEWVSAQRGALPTVEPAADRLSATVTGAEPGEYRLWVSAYGSGFLGTAAKRHASTTFVVQSAQGDYLVIDLAAGPEAASYPVSHLDTAPPGGWPDDYKTTKLVLRRVLAGAFTMGSPEGELGRNSDETEHSVTLADDFYIGVFEVTQKQWERVMGTWPSYFSNVAYRDARPVEGVSWDDIRGGAWPGTPAGSGQPAAGTFVQRLRDRTGIDLDLPSEAQWEYACRAGTTTALNSGKNLTGTEICPNMAKVGRYWYNGGSGYAQDGNLAVATAAVGSYLPNAWGLYDLHGNVWEWCLDWRGGYPSTVSDPLGPATGSDRMLRGGSWCFNAGLCRSALRYYYYPSHRDRYSGFRFSAPAGSR